MTGPALSFRTTITLATWLIVTALAGCLIVVQLVSFHAATRAAASAYMDAAAANALGLLEAQVSKVSLAVGLLSSNPDLAGSDAPSAAGNAVGLFKTALQELPQVDSFHVGYDNGSWLQVRRVDTLATRQRQRLEAPEAAFYNVNLVRPTGAGPLPMQRTFETEDGGKLAQVELPNYGYDARQRPWYRDTQRAGRSLVSAPYPSFSIGVPMMTLSAPLVGRVAGVLAADLKLDQFSERVDAQRPGEHGAAILFDDTTGALIAHPQFAALMDAAMADPARPDLPTIHDLKEGLAPAVLRGWDGGDGYEGIVADAAGHDHFFRLSKFAFGHDYHGHLLLLAAEDDFLQDVRRLQVRATIIALVTGAAFVPVVWLFGSRMSRSLRRLTAQAGALPTLSAPDSPPVTSAVKEIAELGATLDIARRTIWSFAHFVPKEIVRGIINGSISTELGGIRREVAILFTDVRDFTGLAENADPDALMRQASRYFTALTEVFLAEGGTVDKYIGDAVMVFWNAPHLQPDHVERACRAALAARDASEALNTRFAAEGLPRFVTRIGLHVGEAVVGNVGSAERMDYTVLGSSVNLAARLEGLNRDYGTSILVSEAVRERVAGRFRFRPVASVIAKGMSQETQVHELVGPEGDPPLPTG